MILIATKTILNSVPQSVNLEGSDIKLPTHFASYVSVLISLFPTAVLCCICFQELHQISAICHYLSEDVNKKLLCVFVLSSLFYCNLLLAVYPNYFVSKLQKVQNNAARLIFRTFTSGHITRLIFRTFTSAHITPMLHSLHWLPIEQRIEYKLSLLCFKIISHQALICLLELLHLYTPSWQLRSSADTWAFRIPSICRKSSGQHSFSYQVAAVWNQLSISVHHSTSVSSFRSYMKAFLFSKIFFSVPFPWDKCVCVCMRVWGCVFHAVWMKLVYPIIRRV